MSQLTSDYWQGDEPKFQKVIENQATQPGGDPPIYLSPIRYDKSAARFQVTASRPVLNDHGEPALGVIVIGLSIEEALSDSEQY